MSFFPYFHNIRQDLLQLFTDIERDLGLESFPTTEAGQRQLLESEQQQQGAGTQQGATTLVAQPQETQLSTNIDFSKPLAANFKILDEGDKFVATGEFPGVRPEDLHVSVQNGMLTLDARRGIAKERRDVARQSYSYSSSSERVARTIPLPMGVDPSRVETTFNNGFLKLQLGKSKEALQAEDQNKAAQKQQQQTLQQQGQTIAR